jgi:hypothetical protein
MRQLIREEIANANHSRPGSPVGIAAPVERDQCNEATNRESMDHTNTETSGDFTSLQEAEEDGRRFIEAIQQGNLPKPLSQARGRKRRALP